MLLCGFASGALLLLILAFLAGESAQALSEVGPARFVTDAGWRPSGGVDRGQFSLAPMIAATALSTLGAVVLAAPLGVAVAIYSSAFAPRAVAALCRRSTELLAGVPSVVFGLWGLTTVVPLIGRLAPPGPSLLSAVLVLALMILPTVALTSEAALSAVPRELLLSAASLGLSRWAVIRRLMLPAARAGIASGVLLAVVRALGETMAVMMVAGNVVRYPSVPFDPVRTLTANMALEMSYAVGLHRSALFVSGLALMVVVLALVAAVEWLGGRRRPGRAAG